MWIKILLKFCGMTLICWAQTFIRNLTIGSGYLNFRIFFHILIWWVIERIKFLYKPPFSMSQTAFHPSTQHVHLPSFSFTSSLPLSFFLHSQKLLFYYGACLCNLIISYDYKHLYILNWNLKYIINIFMTFVVCWHHHHIPICNLILYLRIYKSYNSDLKKSCYLRIT
jgi:hypothetical protein